MDIKQILICDLIPYHNNNKKHTQEQIELVAKSIKEYGFVQPLVIEKDGTIIIGHCRYSAALFLKLDAVPCLYADTLTKSQIRGLRLMDNKSNQSEWDFDNIKFELGELQLEGFDIGLTGFDVLEFDEEKFNPNINPNFKINQVNEEILQKKEKELETKFTEGQSIKYVKCPYCEKEFGLEN